MCVAWLCRVPCNRTAAPQLFHEHRHGVGEASGLDGLPSALATTCYRRQPDSELQEGFCLPYLVLAQFLDQQRRQRHGARLPFGSFSRHPFRLFGAGDDRKLARVEIERVPPQGRYLSPPQAAHAAKQDRDEIDLPLAASITSTVLRCRGPASCASTFGGFTASAGLRASICQITACCRACRNTRCM